MKLVTVAPSIADAQDWSPADARPIRLVRNRETIRLPEPPAALDSADWASFAQASALLKRRANHATKQLLTRAGVEIRFAANATPRFKRTDVVQIAAELAAGFARWKKQYEQR